MTNRYENGKIYKLISDEMKEIYIGSTCLSLAKRMYHHRGDYKQYKLGKRGYITSFELFELGFVDIVLIENYSCNSKEELHARERYWIEKNKNKCVNKLIPNRTHKEYLTVHREKILKYNKTYNDSRKDKRSMRVFCNWCKGSYTFANKDNHMRTTKHRTKELQLMQDIFNRLLASRKFLTDEFKNIHV
jgi:hypothetical protein